MIMAEADNHKMPDRLLVALGGRRATIAHLEQTGEALLGRAGARVFVR